MLALGRVVDDATTRARLVDRTLDRRRSEILELEIGEGLPQFALGFARRCGERIGLLRRGGALGSENSLSSIKSWQRY